MLFHESTCIITKYQFPHWTLLPIRHECFLPSDTGTQQTISEHSRQLDKLFKCQLIFFFKENDLKCTLF